MKNFKFLKKFSSALMLSLVVGGVAANTVGGVSLYASEIENDNLEDEATSTTSEEVIEENTSSSETSSEIESSTEDTEKQENAPNSTSVETGDTIEYEGATFSIQTEEKTQNEDLAENFFIDEDGVKRYPEYDNHSREELEKIAKDNDSRTYVREDGLTKYIYYTEEDANEIKSKVDDKKIVGALTYQESLTNEEEMKEMGESINKDTKAGYTYTSEFRAGPIADFGDFDTSGYGEFYPMYINGYFMFCSEPDNGQGLVTGVSATRGSAASTSISKTVGTANAKYDETNNIDYYWAGTYRVYEQIGFSGIAPNVPSYASTEYNDLTSSVDDYEVGNTYEYAPAGGVQKGYSQLGIPSIFDPQGNVKVVKDFNNTSNQNVPEICSQIEITATDSIGKTVKPMSEDSGKCVVTFSNYAGGEKVTLTETKNDSPYWIIKDGSATATIIPDDTVLISGSDGIVNQTSITDLSVTKTVTNTSNQNVDLSDIYPDVKVTLTPTGSTPSFKTPSDYTNKSLSTSGKHTFQNLVPGTYKLTETYPASMGGVVTSQNITISKNSGVAQGSKSTTLKNELKVADVVAWKEIENPTSIDTSDLVNPNDIKVTLTPTGSTPAFKNANDYKNKPLSWPTTAQQTKYGVSAETPIYVFEDLLPGTYKLTETYPAYLGGKVETVNITVKDSDTKLAKDNAFVKPSGHLINKIIAGNILIEKDWSNEELNELIDEEDVINESAKVKPSDFSIHITGLGGLYDETFTFNDDYKILTPDRSMPYGNYEYTEINDSTASHIIVGEGSFSIKEDGVTIDKTNNAIVNELDLGSIDVEKTIDMDKVEQFCPGTDYTTTDGETIVIAPEDCVEYTKQNLVKDGDVEVTIKSAASNGFSYEETKPLKWDGLTYGTSFENLPLGTYTVTETKMTGQMVGTTISQTVEITKDGEIVEAHDLENRILSTRLKVVKRDVDTGGVVGGGTGGNSDKRATFAIWDYDMEKGEITGDKPIDVISTNEDAEATSRWIPLTQDGTRTVFVQELDAPDGYFNNGIPTPSLNEGGYVFELTAGQDGETIEFDYNDVEIEDAEVNIIKTIIDTDGNVLTDQDLSGFEFTIFNNVESLPNFGDIANGYESEIGVGEELPQILLTDNLGEAFSNKLLANYSDNTIGEDPVNRDMEYLISETGIPEAYKDWMFVKPEDKEFVMTDDNIVYTFSFVNVLKDIVITINKTDTNGNPVEGVEFTVYNDATLDSETNEYAYNKDDIVGTYTTDSNGQITMDKYSVNETLYIVETQTRLGQDGEDMYYYSSEPIIITPDYIENNLDTSGEVIYDTIAVENTPVTGNIVLNKYDDLGNALLSGAEYNLSYSYDDGVKVHNESKDLTINETLELNDLPVYNYDGSYVEYTLTETKAPTGYYLNDPVTFHFKNKDGQIEVVVDSGTNIETNYDEDITTTLNLYDNRVVVDLNILKVAEGMDRGDFIPLNYVNYATKSTEMSEDELLDAYTPLGSHRLEGATFDISTIITPEMLAAYDYKYENGFAVPLEDGEEATYEDSKISDYYTITYDESTVYPLNTSVNISNTHTVTIETTENGIARITIDQNSILVKYDGDITFTVVQNGSKDEITITNGETKSWTTVPGSAYVLNTELTEVTPNVEYTQNANVMHYTSEVDKEGHLEMLLPIATTNGTPMIYKIEETEAPSGYKILEEPTYVYFTLDSDGNAIVHTFDDLTTLEGISFEAETTTPNSSAFEFDYDEFFTNLFIIEEVDQENTREATEHKDTHLNVDATDAYNLALGDVNYNDFVLEIWIVVKNELISGNLLVDKTVEDNSTINENGTFDYLDTYATNGYETISEADLELLEDVPYTDLENIETNKIYLEDLTENKHTEVIKENVWTIDETNLGTYSILGIEGSTMTVNGEEVELSTDTYTDVILSVGDVVSTTGNLVILVEDEQEIPEEDIEYSQGDFLNTLNAPYEVNITETTPYYVTTTGVELRLNGITLTIEDGTYLVKPLIGQEYRLLSGSVDVYSATEVAPVNHTSQKVYTDNLENDYPIIVAEDGIILGGNVEYRLYNEESDDYEYDHTLLTTKDGRAYFKNIPLEDKNGDQIVYYLQEVGAPSPMNVDPTAYKLTFGINEEGNLFIDTEEKVTYDENGNPSEMETIESEEENTGIQSVTEDSNLSVETFRTDTMFEALKGEKTFEDSDGDGYLSAGEDITYTIKVDNKAGYSQTALIQDDVVSQLSDYFVIDEEALSQELVINEELDPNYQEEDKEIVLNATTGEYVVTDETKGTYVVEVAEPTIVTYNGSDYFLKETSEKYEFNSGDTLLVTSGELKITNKQIEEEDVETYTLQNLVDGFEYSIPGYSSVSFSFTLTGKDVIESTDYCVAVTNIATITDPDGNIITPEIELPILCKPEIEADKVSMTADGDEFISAGEDVTYTIGVENTSPYPGQDVLIQDDVVNQLSDYFVIDEEALSQILDIQIIKPISSINEETESEVESETDSEVGSEPASESTEETEVEENTNEEVPTYTLQDLVDGITVSEFPAYTRVEISFTLKANDTLGTNESEVCGQEVECPVVVNQAYIEYPETITPVDPEICEPITDPDTGDIIMVDPETQEPCEPVDPEICEPITDPDTGDIIMVDPETQEPCEPVDPEICEPITDPDTGDIIMVDPETQEPCDEKETVVIEPEVENPVECEVEECEETETPDKTEPSNETDTTPKENLVNTGKVAGLVLIAIAIILVGGAILVVTKKNKE